MITINKEIMVKVLDDKTFKDEVCELLNRLIDLELDKKDSEIDFDFIEECSRVIILVQNNEDLFNKELEDIFANDEMIKKMKKFGRKGISTSLKVILIAAVLLLSTITANAAVNEFTGKSIIENLASASEEDTTVLSDETTTVHEEEATSAHITTQKPVLKDDSFLFRKKTPHKKADGVYIRKENSDSSVISHGKEIKYKKKGTAPKKTLEFHIKSEFDEEDYLATEYGIPYCELTQNNRHDFTSWTVTKNPDCSNFGEKERICKVCSSKQICPVAATGNHKGNLISSLEKASIYNTGRCIYECSNCDAVIEKKISSPKYVLLDQDEFYYNGKKQQPKVIAVLDSDGYEIPAKYYKVRYFSDTSKNCMYAYSVIVDFDCDYFDESIVANYNIYPMSNNLAGIDSQKGALIPFWNRNSLSDSDNTTGYQIQYSMHSDFSSAKTVNAKGIDNLSVEIDNLKSNKTYYVRMRVYYYDEIFMKNMYSSWSDVRCVEVK